MRRTLLAAVLVFAACGCGSTQGPKPNHAASGSGPDSNLICTEETPTGSHLSHEVCRTPEQIEDERKAAEELMRTPGGRTRRHH
jgi:hypothetical protein